ncbi:hypothetical protein [Hymenobacter lapidiphilus]|uniref:hypothetical protein n=1 Tax=Hymenobacter sp. CCM 8763 TaxID=2303334 RepID=UPI0011C12BA5|nr:hypothetical protein [Hymenobacter sp. CCM 8763]
MMSQDELRRLFMPEAVRGEAIVALARTLAAAAKVNFVMPRLHMYDVYSTRLDLSRKVTGDWYEGLAETVQSLEESQLTEVRLIETELAEGDCILFTDPAIDKVLGVIYFNEKIA